MATLLSIVQGASRRLKLSVPSIVAASTDGLVLELFEHLNEEGRDQMRRHDWQILRKEKTLTTIASESQGLLSTLIGADFERVVNGTFWNRTEKEPLYGPLSPQEWQDQKANTVATAYNSFAFRNGYLIIFPAPEAGETLALEYISKHWCTTSGGTGQEAFAADTDVPLLDAELLTKGLVWRFREANGLDYAEAFRQYEAHLNQLRGSESARPVLNLAPPMRTKLYPNIPEGSWPSS